MRRRLSEQPRLVAVQLLLVLALVGAGFGIARLTSDGDKVPPPTAAALDRARSESRQDRRALREERAGADRLRAQIARERRRSASLRTRARELQGALRRTVRALARGPAGPSGQ